MEERVFERKIYSEMIEWKRQNDGRTALMIEGARRVGKSTIVEHFAQNVGLSIEENKNRFKMYVADTGLMVTLCFWDKKYAENVIYEKLLSDKMSVNLGYVYENLVAQMLRAAGNKLFYYTFPKDERHNYEVDFLLSRGAKLWPVEVKSEGYSSHSSLDAFCKKFSSRIDKRLLVCTKDLRREGQTILLPVYMVGEV